MKFETGVIEAFSLLQIEVKNRDSEWEADREQWLEKWEPELADGGKCACADHQGGPCAFCMEAKHGL